MSHLPLQHCFLNPNKSNKHTAVASDQTIKTANQFSLLPNPEVDNMDLNRPQEQTKLTQVQNTHNTKKHHKISIKIPTIING
jgi:hypothetical protein